ncbi:protein of unknown function [Burkholderia multivorans]
MNFAAAGASNTQDEPLPDKTRRMPFRRFGATIVERRIALSKRRCSGCAIHNGVREKKYKRV